MRASSLKAGMTTERWGVVFSRGADVIALEGVFKGLITSSPLTGEDDGRGLR